MQKALWELASAGGVADRLRYMGIRNDVTRLMDAMDIIAVPSQMESFGMVIIEAMARSKPVVAARVGGIPEIITHGETGLLFGRTPGELAAAVASLLENPSERERLGRQGCENGRLRFSAGAMVDNIESLYQSMLTKGESR